HAAAMRDAFPMPPHRGGAAARAVLTRAIVHIPDVATDPEYRLRRLAETTNARKALSVPLLRDGEPIGAITVGGDVARPFSDKQIALLKTFADQAVIAIENVRLFTELQEKNRALTEAHAQVTETLEQQTATSEVLRVIASSPTDVQPVFAAVLASAARLCDAPDATMFRGDGDVFRLAAHQGPITPDPLGTPPRLTASNPPPRPVLEETPINVADLHAEIGKYPEGSAFARALNFRTVLSVPLLRADGAIGAITIRRVEVRPFTNRQVELLKTFADQAVIAIENVRL